jgi:hypothetical protein
MFRMMNQTVEVNMTEDTSQKPQKEATEKATPIGRMTIGEVDAALADCDKTIKTCSDLVKAKLTSNATLPTSVLRDLSKANAHKGKLMMRRITLLIDSGEASVMELLDKLMKVKLPKTQA